MKKLLFFLSLLLLTVSACAQPSETLTGFVGKFTFQSFSAGGSSDVTGTLDAFNDQTNQYFANNIQVGDVIWDNQGNRWEVMVINSSNLLQADVDLRDINSAGGTPLGVGFLTRETENVGLSLLVPDNNIGISQQLKSRVETHNMLLIDRFIAAYRDSVYQGTDLGDTTNISSPTVGDVIVTDDGNLGFYDGDNWVTFSGSGGGETKSIYDAGQGFYCYCTPGVTVSTSAQGTYVVTIPADTDVSSLQKNFTNAGSEFTVGGEAIINVTWSGASGNWNTSFSDAVVPDIKLIDGSGTQREPGAVSVTTQTTSVGAGTSSTTIANINGVGTPVRVKLQF
ncbi:hypothetical protein [Flavilitoribacter nigricans]|uniref:DUF5689 domain-containing protein n=1 Tax=Flavilitoribacter nigricans (strain ATCC 23147 / DSM 23189 / NBRC 102662 / NCIMB 1420 / SS-2) TaxID=1122177 RepID=A0A2D0MX87_FLAN2|nr:hypothetical protein [Flavilitoribacter nigricans]PHN00768.1 hypothetical protein CRP01_40625 [Flavilitoribacter nigricans DSM 23189 = NBRC 102662]